MDIHIAKLIYFLHLLNLDVSAYWATSKTNNEMPKREVLTRRLCKSQWSIDGACLAAEVCNNIRQQFMEYGEIVIFFPIRFSL